MGRGIHRAGTPEPWQAGRRGTYRTCKTSRKSPDSGWKTGRVGSHEDMVGMLGTFERGDG